jgi:hypothetical protein
MTDSHSNELNAEQKRRHWETHIESWQRSGLSQLAYCREHDLKPHQFTYWKKRIVSADGAISFVPLHFSQNLPVAVKTTTINVVTPNGYRFELGAGFDPALVKQLLAAIQSI